MLKLLKSNNPVNYLLAFLMMAALWGYKFVVMPTAVDAGGFHSYFFRFSYESSLFQYIFTTIAFALAFAFACYVSKANFRYQVVESGYQLPTLFFVLLSGSVINAQRFIPEMLATIFMSMAVLRMFGMYNRREAIRDSLDIGLLFGFTLLFAYKYIVLMPAIIIVMAIVKPISWRDIVSFLLSMAFVLGIAFCFVWLYGDWHELIESVKTEFSVMVVGEKYNYLNYLFRMPVIYAVLVSLLSIFTLKVFRKAAEMKYHHSMLFLMAYSGVIMLLPISSNESVWLMYFPLSYLLSNVMVNAKHIVVQRLVLYGLMVCLVISQVLQAFYFDSIF